MTDRPIPLSVEAAGVTLAGSLWLPEALPPRAAVLMWPGSGPSDRDNDVFFPPIRRHLLASAIAVASFDKRGVGGSSGDWRDADIVDQAADAQAIADQLFDLEALAGGPLGLFGHSQGGWVVLEAAAADDRLAFVVASSGPGVSPGRQGRYAIARGAERDGLEPDEVQRLLEEHDALGTMLRQGTSFAQFRQTVELEPDRATRYRSLERYTLIPGDEREWAFFRRLFDHDPRPALERISCPILALFGGADRVVPVVESVAVYHEAREARGELKVHVFPGADHRCGVGAPSEMAPGYFDLLAAWIAGTTARKGQASVDPTRHGSSTA